ncbi:MAG: hypothetical protein A2271_01720 [Candidatus Moranbacteria bacterium RIFOXYA12_FULL_35_19]|nr:MAG: hypothetical protein UR78_C0016G0013 [Candidatus Moranbacteria bacterium GW2011_GWF2_35_39]OGI32407.1 MAG: hypothetical protein A2489_02180 [Candidatus Moranbacteria bacterium RIFOXYC12_FULL_36_13]OGI33101.1 MAG: hypothetical protein A2343_02715 [Candidatus Moranbacteria bacterium RIFOXYB12_FULL_35_8]OGI35491.1 MAG: hypothetical protein A2271_01720 [Candidatus Moranbacteria bacterium RIFOXYA12_FULL_35_19]
MKVKFFLSDRVEFSRNAGSDEISKDVRGSLPRLEGEINDYLNDIANDHVREISVQFIPNNNDYVLATVVTL